MRLRSLTLAAAMALPIPALAIPLEDADSFYVFGDSLSDDGNLFDQTGNPPPPYFEGRFSNGPVWADTAAGVVAGPTANFAFGGARAQGPGPQGLPDFDAQIDLFAGATGGGAGDDALAAVWFGANDIFQSIGTAALGPSIAAAVDAIGDGIERLSTLGIDEFVTFNLPDLSRTPAFLGVDAAAQATDAFNGALAAELATLQGDVTLVDVETLFDDLAADPVAFGESFPVAAGITVLDEPCLETDPFALCADPGAYLFWDGVHPTTKAHQAIAEAARRALADAPAPIPLPAGAPLLLMGLAALGVARRRA